MALGVKLYGVQSSCFIIYMFNKECANDFANNTKEIFYFLISFYLLIYGNHSLFAPQRQLEPYICFLLGDAPL